jgi:ribose-phosphate pyrophosphokinase
MEQRKAAGERQFITPEEHARDLSSGVEPNRGRLLIAACASAVPLAQRVCRRYQELTSARHSSLTVPFLGDIESSFSDSETRIRLEEHVGGADVFLFQYLYDPAGAATVNQNYMAFLIAVRAFREHGASHVSAVLPYLAYSRQDKPTKFKREATAAKLMADLCLEAGMDGLITWAPHSRQIHGFYGRNPIHLLDPLNMFLDVFGEFRSRQDVIVVAPDAGAAKLATHVCRELDISCALASKVRPRPEEVEITDVIGDFRGKKTAVILDDMINTAGTVYHLCVKLVKEKGVESIHLGAGHNLCRPEAFERISALHERFGLARFITTDSIQQTEQFQSLPFFSVRCLDGILSGTINRVHYGRSVSELFYRE